MPVDKEVKSFDEAVADVGDGAVVGVSCWGGALMSPENLIRALHRKGPRNLTIVAQGLGVGEKQTIMGLPWFLDHGILVEKGLVKRIISGFPFYPRAETPVFRDWKAGKLEVENLPHGTLAIRLWAAGAGVGGVYVRTGVGTVIEQGKEKRVIDGEEYILELPLRLDFALIRAFKADRFGNLIYRGVGRATGPVVARAARVTIAEVDDIVQPGEIEPEHVITPGIYVHRVVKVPEGR